MLQRIGGQHRRGGAAARGGGAARGEIAIIDALLYAVRDSIRAAGIGYGYAECEITDEEGTPPPRCGDWFVSVHRGATRSTNDNCLMEVYDFSLTLTARLGRVVLDRIGDRLVALGMARTQANRQGFNAKVEQLRGMFHMNWAATVLTGQTPPSANDNLAAWADDTAATTVYGFSEPARYRGPVGRTQLVGGEWFGADPDSADVGLKAELRFEGARRMQPQTLPVGPFA